MAYRSTPKMVERKEQRRAHLLAVATRTFAQHGYHAATVPMIVQASGSSTGSFYFYFRNKEDVFAAVLEDLDARLSAHLNQAIGSAGSDPLAHMKAAVTAFVGFLAEHPDEARILVVESSGLGGRLAEVRRAVIERHTRAVEEALVAMQDRFPQLNVATTACCWTGAVLEAVFRWLDQPSQQRIAGGQLAEAVMRFNLRGIGAA